MIGPLALHGGGEFLTGDEPFLRRLLDLGAERVRARGPATPTVRVELVTTAVARHRPDLTFAVGSAAFERVAAEAGRSLPRLAIHHARVIDAPSAADVDVAERLATADLVYLPGGDPDAVVGILGGTAALRAIAAARARGAVVAGASAGAMALGERTWTPDGWISGFGWAGRLVVVAHATATRVATARGEVDLLPRGGDLAIAGLPERAGLIGGPTGWAVVGAAGAWWWPPHAAAPRREPDGATIAA